MVDGGEAKSRFKTRQTQLYSMFSRYGERLSNIPIECCNKLQWLQQRCFVLRSHIVPKFTSLEKKKPLNSRKLHFSPLFTTSHVLQEDKKRAALKKAGSTPACLCGHSQCPLWHHRGLTFRSAEFDTCFCKHVKDVLFPFMTNPTMQHVQFAQLGHYISYFCTFQCACIAERKWHLIPLPSLLKTILSFAVKPFLLPIVAAALLSWWQTELMSTFVLKIKHHKGFRKQPWQMLNSMLQKSHCFCWIPLS